MAIKFRNLSSGGGSLPTNPEFESIKANSHIFNIYDKANRRAIAIENHLDVASNTEVGDYTIGNVDGHISIWGKEDRLSYNGSPIPKNEDVEQLARDIIAKEFYYDDYNSLEIDFANAETIENSFAESVFAIEESDFESETPILKFLNDNTMNSKISFVNTNNSSLDLASLELTYYIFDKGEKQSVIFKNEIEIGKLTIDKLNFLEDYNESILHEGTLVVNHYKFAENISNSLISVVENTSQKIVFSGKIPANTLIKYDNNQQCWIVDFAIQGVD